MKNSKSNCSSRQIRPSANRSGESGQGLVVLIIILAIIGVGFWFLFSNKKTMEREANEFGKEMITALTVKHDLRFFVDHLSPQMRLDYPPSQQEYIISQFQQLGAPQQPIKIDSTVTFESQFFSPTGHFTAHLFYPTQAATLDIDVSHPVGKWQLDNMTFSSGQGAVQ